ncbi:MAG: hypothetical protein V7K38_15755 [Nostoc sp.]
MGRDFKFEDIESSKFAQLVTDTPDWVEWMGYFVEMLLSVSLPTY